MSKEEIIEYGNVTLGKYQLLTIIGEIEGHDNLGQNTKSTKYEHIIPLLAKFQCDKEVEGVLLIMNTVGGDVSCGLAIAEMVASLQKPTVSLVIGDSHSIAVPLSAAADYSFIVPSATVIVHPVRMNGMVLGTRQTYDQFQMMQDRILGFIANHSKASQVELEEMMMNTQMLSKDLGTVLVGEQAVEKGIIDEVGGIGRAIEKLSQLTCNEEGSAL